MAASVLAELPEEARALANELARWCGIDRGRITLLINDGLVVDGYAERRFRPAELERYSGASFCSCQLNTSTVHGLCVVCRRPKRPEQADPLV